MSLNSFAPNSKIESAKVNANFTNLEGHALFVNLKWFFPGGLTTQTSKDYFSVPGDVNWDRVDLVVETVPTGAAIIVDIERSTDDGATWVTIFTNTSNRPQVAISARAGNTTTIDVPGGTGNDHMWRAKISQVGSTIAGANLGVTLKGKYLLD